MIELPEFNSDAERWRWVAENQHLDITVVCDNDGTWVETSDGTCLLSFWDYTGNHDGMFHLFDLAGIRARSC